MQRELRHQWVMEADRLLYMYLYMIDISNKTNKKLSSSEEKVTDLKEASRADKEKVDDAPADNLQQQPITRQQENRIHL